MTVGIRVAVISKFGCSPTNFDKILPTAAGFVLIAKDEDARKLLLSCAGHLPQDISLQPARNWASLMLPNIPVHIILLDGQVTILESHIVSEIERITGVTPKSVRRHSKSNFGARYRNWVAFFESRSAPRTDSDFLTTQDGQPQSRSVKRKQSANVAFGTTVPAAALGLQPADTMAH